MRDEGLGALDLEKPQVRHAADQRAPDEFRFEGSERKQRVGGGDRAELALEVLGRKRATDAHTLYPDPAPE